MHPVALLGQQLFIRIALLGFSSRGSAFRLAATPLLGLCSSLNIPRCMAYLHRSSWAALVSGYSTTFLAQNIATILIERQEVHASAEAETRNKLTAPAKDVGRMTGRTNKDAWSRLRSGINATVSFGRSGTQQEVRNVPLFSEKDRSSVPSRTRFLRHHVILVVSCYLTLDLLGLGAGPEKNAAFFGPDKIPLFAVSARFRRQILQ